ncbi:hypothetical protein BH11ARM1_BH11ARM1_07390 [soil metagenome]
MNYLCVTKDDKVVLGQSPNWPLILGLLADVVSFFASGSLKQGATWLAQASFALWAVMEIGWGVNPMRRILGGIVLVLISLAVLRG